MSLDYAYTIQPLSVTVHTLTGRAFTWASDHPNFDKVKDALRENADVFDIIDLMDIRKAILNATSNNGNVRVDRGGVFYKDVIVHGTITERILDHIGQDLPVLPLLNFLDNLLQNTRREAVLSLYDFLESNEVPITPDGEFLVYKKVDEDYRDYYTGQFDNSLGAVVEVEPWQVESDRERTCSNGLHVCARKYLPSYYGGSGHVVICSVNPAHVVAVPHDYDNAKMRVYKYTVVGELTEEDKADIFDDASLIEPGEDMDHVRWDKEIVLADPAKVDAGLDPSYPDESEDYEDNYDDEPYYDGGDDDDDLDYDEDCAANPTIVIIEGDDDVEEEPVTYSSPIIDDDPTNSDPFSFLTGGGDVGDVDDDEYELVIRIPADFEEDDEDDDEIPR